MSAHQMPRPVGRLPVGWAIMLAFDFLATVLAALVLCAVGVLLPEITEDHGPGARPTSPGALACFTAALVLLSSLAVTARAVPRAATERSRTLALRSRPAGSGCWCSRWRPSSRTASSRPGSRNGPPAGQCAPQWNLPPPTHRTSPGSSRS